MKRWRELTLEEKIESTAQFTETLFWISVAALAASLAALTLALVMVL